MIAYDVPNWRIREEGGYQEVPESRQQEIDQEQAQQAFSLISKALEFHPESPRLYLEIGQIYLNRLDDPENAAPWFLKASKQPDAPRYAARIYAELLRRQGKQSEAYKFLVGLHAELPDDDPYARKNIVLERIRDLEQALQIPIPERYHPGDLGDPPSHHCQP
jgi:tetratricopeptide (TPR) repeat protein